MPCGGEPRSDGEPNEVVATPRLFRGVSSSVDIGRTIRAFRALFCVLRFRQQ